MRLKTKLIYGLAFLFLIQLFIGIYSVVSIFQIRSLYTIEEEKIENFVALEQSVKNGQLAFKKQVQEWKNILLRGNDSKNFDKYLDSFNKEELFVQNNLKENIVLFKNFGIDTSLAESLISEHKILGEKYKAGLKLYNKNNIESFKIVDNHVKGIDRVPTDIFDKLIAMVTEVKESNSKETHLKISKIVSFKILSLFLIILSGFVFTVIISLLVIKSIFVPISEMTSALADISEGDGDLTHHISFLSENETGIMAKYINLFITKTRNMIIDIQNGGSEIKLMAEELHKANSSLADKNSIQAGNMEEVSSEVEEISSSFGANTESIVSVEKSIEKSMVRASTVEAESKELIISMRNISSESKKIDSITEVIDEIAFQTNLLALNAWIGYNK